MCTGLQILLNIIQDNAGKFGLRISKIKIKSNASWSTRHLADILNNTLLDDVEILTYLGSVICNDGSSESGINAPISNGSGTFQRLNSIWKSIVISINLKIKLFNTLVIPTVLYGSKMCHLTKKLSSKLDIFQRVFARS